MQYIVKNVFKSKDEAERKKKVVEIIKKQINNNHK